MCIRDRTNGIIECTSEMSLFSKLFMYRTSFVSEWYVLNTGCVKNGDVLLNDDLKIPVLLISYFSAI